MKEGLRRIGCVVGMGLVRASVWTAVGALNGIADLNRTGFPGGSLA